MESLRYRLIEMHRCRGINRKTLRYFLKYNSTLEKIYHLSPHYISQRFSISQKNAFLFYKDLHNTVLKKQLQRDKDVYDIITIFDDDYPDVLKRITDPPLVLYANGDTSLMEQKPSLSVIGTRKPSANAWKKTYQIVKPLIQQNWLIVSGMAKGIDSFAHLITLNNSGKTIAVLGGGFHHIYPLENTRLYHEISKSGLVLSEYPPHVRPVRYHFPERNRIISGLSLGTLVIEATERSGTLITVDQALEQGRDVYAVPDSPFVPESQGCLYLIQDGAKLVTCSDDILEDLGHMQQRFF